MQATYFDQKFYSTFVLAGDGSRDAESFLLGKPGLNRKPPASIPKAPPAAPTAGAIKQEVADVPAAAVWRAPPPPPLPDGNVQVRFKAPIFPHA